MLSYTGQRTTGAKKALKMVKGDCSVRDSVDRSDPRSQPFILWLVCLVLCTETRMESGMSGTFSPVGLVLEML